MNFWWLDDRILIHVIFSHRQFNNSNVHISKSIAILKAIALISIQMGSISLIFKKKTYTKYWATNYLDSLEAPNILLLCRLLFRLCLESFMFLSKNRWWPNYYSFIFIYFQCINCIGPNTGSVTTFIHNISKSRFQCIEIDFKHFSDSTWIDLYRFSISYDFSRSTFEYVSFILYTDTDTADTDIK